MEFDLTEFNVPEGEREAAADVTATIAMDWISSDNATAETDYRWVPFRVFLCERLENLDA